MSAEFWWTVGTTLALVIFNAGIVYQMIKTKPSELRVGEMIEEKLENHCPNSDKIIRLENSKAEMIKYREKISNDLKTETKEMHTTLSDIKDNQQEIKFNLKALCKMQGVDYIETNGH